MIGIRGIIISAIALALGSMGLRSTHAAPLVNVLGDTGTLTVTTYAPTQVTSSASVPNPYGSGSMTITQLAAGWKLTLVPTSGFFASANNLGGGKTSIISGLLAFDITFDSAINLTTNIYEDGIWSKSGNGRVAANSGDLPSGIQITELDNGSAEQLGNSFSSSALFTLKPAGTWTLFDQVTGFSHPYKKYHIVIDNDLLAESLPNEAPGFAAIAKKDFSIIFSTDGSTSGGGPQVPEPASLAALAIGATALLARRRR